MIYATLTSFGLLLPNDGLSNEHKKKLKRRLSITTKSFNGWPVKTHAFTQTKKNFIIPRFTPLPRGIKIETTNSINRGRRGNFNGFSAILTPNQEAVFTHIMNTFFTTELRIRGLAGVIVNMPPGEGKTFLGMAIMHILGRKTAVIVPNTYLLKQWLDICYKFFPNTSIGVYYGTRKMDGDIVIHVINSALTDSFKRVRSPIPRINGVEQKQGLFSRTCPSNDWWAKFGLIIYDEIHMYCSENRAEIFKSAQAQYMLGLSATPDQRLDKLDPLAVWSVGSILESSAIDGFAENTTQYTTDVKVIKYKCKTKYAEVELSAAGSVSVPKMVNNFVEDPDRNAIILSEAMRLYHLGLCIFIFTDRRGHAEYLVNELQRYQYEFGRDNFNTLFPAKRLAQLSTDLWTMIYNYLYPVDMNVISLLGGANDGDIFEAKTFSRIIVTTYAYSSTGVSIDKLNAAILATPRKSNMTQILGRIYRLSGDATITRRIVDLVDWNTPLKKQYYERRKVYGKNATNMEIVEC